MVSRKLPDLEKVAEEIGKLGRKSLAIAAHAGRIEEIGDIAAKVKGEFGRIDILVNNAATSPAMISALDTDESLWDAIINLNLKGLFFLSQAVARVMKEQGGGKIINVASVDGFRPEPNLGIYAISKAGVIMATKVMALEWAQYNIRVNAIAPGNVHTRFGDSRFAVVPDYQAELVKRTPIGRIAEPDEMVGAIIYLASRASSFTTGETLVVDGGTLIG